MIIQRSDGCTLKRTKSFTQLITHMYLLNHKSVNGPLPYASNKGHVSRPYRNETVRSLKRRQRRHFHGT